MMLLGGLFVQMTVLIEKKYIHSELLLNSMDRDSISWKYSFCKVNHLPCSQK